MSRTKTKTRPKNTPLYMDENGCFTMFIIPHAAMWYGLACTKLKDQDKIDDGMDEITELPHFFNEN